jgi:hypothetical protein
MVVGRKRQQQGKSIKKEILTCDNIFSCFMNSSVPCLGKQNLIRTNKGTLFHLTVCNTHCMLTPFAQQPVLQCSVSFHSSMTSSSTFTERLTTTIYHLNPLSFLYEMPAFVLHALHLALEICNP